LFSSFDYDACSQWRITGRVGIQLPEQEWNIEIRLTTFENHLMRSWPEPVEFAPRAHPDGREWLANIPSLTDTLQRRWRLQVPESKISTGYSAVVIPVQRHGERLVLNLTWPAHRVVDEARALAAWAGRGVVQLVDADTDCGALLLERLHPERTLENLALFDAAIVADGCSGNWRSPDREAFATFARLPLISFNRLRPARSAKASRSRGVG
jgi:Aminoglycoside/hydroxyurea antibiotic resistance kinase